MSRSATPHTAASQQEAQLRDWMLRGLTGDAAAHQQLLSEMARLLRRFYQRRLGTHHAEVEDLVQETLLAIHTRRATYDAQQPFTAWAYAIARYKLIDYLRRQRVRATVSIDDYAELFGIETHAEPEAQRDVGELLSTLSPPQRDAIELTHLQGLSVIEAAEHTGQSVSSIKVNVHRGLKKLAASLKAATRS